MKLTKNFKSYLEENVSTFLYKFYFYYEGDETKQSI